MIVAVDFDNCLVEYERTKDGDFILKHHAEEVLRHCHDLGIDFVLNTSRYGSYLIKALSFIRRKKLPIRYEFRMSKVCADIYIDDRNIFCDEIRWETIGRELMRYIDENKKHTAHQKDNNETNGDHKVQDWSRLV